MNPLLSIVIANYNYGRFLAEAIESVLSQSCQDFEIIIIDGGSTDESVDIIHHYADGLPPKTERANSAVRLGSSPSPISYWVSEPDKGQSDAFNKGFAKARGRFLTWLNADDVMLPGTIEKLKWAAERHPECEWFVGGCFWLDKEMKIIQCRKAEPMSRIETNAGHVGVWGPSSFFTKRLLDAVGGVDLRFKYAMDGHLWHKFAYLEHQRYRVFCDYAWGLRLHEAAKMSGQNFDPVQKDPNHPRWKQLQKENDWILELYRPKHGMTRWKRLLSICWPKALAGRLDSRRFRRRHYLEMFK